MRAVFLFGIVWMMLGSVVLAQQGESANSASASAAQVSPELESQIDQQIDELLELSRGPSAEPGGEDEDLKRPLELDKQENEGTIPMWNGHQATSRENPLLTEDCEREAMRRGLHRLMEARGIEMEEAVKMAKGHFEERQGTLKNHDPTYAEYLHHISECRNLCNQVVKGLMACHVQSVQAHLHEIVLFAFNSYLVDSNYREGSIREMAQRLDDEPQKNVLLIGRASHIGPKGYNRRLSRSRANAVRDDLQALGVAEDRIKILAFGWEPPQLTSEMAEAYDYETMFRRAGEQQMNQSVLMVLH